MPVLNVQNKTIEVTLPGAKAKITLFAEQSYGNYLDIKSGEDKGLDTSLALLLVMIVGWDFTNEKKEPLPINKENLRFLSVDDTTFLMKQVGKIEKMAKSNKETIKNSQAN